MNHDDDRPAHHLSRRSLLAGGVGILAAMTGGTGTQASSPVSDEIAMADLRGSFDAGQHGVEPGASTRSARAFMDLLEQASKARAPVFLPPGRYEMSGITLPAHVNLSGVSGSTIIAYSGDGSLFSSRDAESLHLSGIRFDGGNRWLGDDSQALLDIRNAADIRIDDCQIVGSYRTGIWLERSSGSIRQSAISGAADNAIFAVECRDLTIESNVIDNCGNGGILIHRWKKGPDGAIVRANRISNILARSGGTGQFGNGINVFQADNVIVDANHISRCAFSALRANAASNIRMSGNTCLNSGETAVYSEFGFEGAQVIGNLIDGAANGISVVNFDHGGRLAVIANNIIRNLSLVGPYDNGETWFGIGLSAEADTNVTGNVIENAPRFGMAFGWGPYLRNVIASANIVMNSPVGCAVSVVDGAGDCILSANLISQTDGIGIAGYRWLDRATGDLIVSPEDAPANIVLSANRLTGGTKS